MKPIYLKIVDHLLEQINSGVYKEGDMLPAETRLLETYGVSRMTMRKSLSLLVEQDLLYRVKGRGTFVKKNRTTKHDAFYLDGFYKEVRAQGLVPSTEVITFEILEPDSLVAEKLKLAPTDKVYHIERLRSIDGKPELLERTYLPISLFSDLTLDAMRGSKYEYIASKGMKIASSRQSVTPELPTEKLQKLLNLDENTPLLKVISIGELDDGTLFEYSINFFKLDQYSFTFVAKQYD